MTLHLSSPRTYELLRGPEFGLPLPSVQTLRRWCRKFNFDPGFIGVALDELGIEASKLKEGPNPVELFACLGWDEMRLCDTLDARGDWKVFGNIDHGRGPIRPHPAEDPKCNLATEAYVMMATMLNRPIRVPIHYILIKGLDAVMRKTLIEEGICMLRERGIFVRATSCDGLNANLLAYEKLGKYRYIES